MPPNSKTILMDSNMARFSMKQTDASGMSTIKAYDFQEAKAASQRAKLTRRFV